MRLICRHEWRAIWPLSLPTDHGSHYFHTPEAGGPVDRKSSAQVGCALAQLGVVEHIAGYFLRARGQPDEGALAGRHRVMNEPPMRLDRGMSSSLSVIFSANLRQAIAVFSPVASSRAIAALQ
jgi:hypothetical protein